MAHLVFVSEGERFGLPADVVEQVVDDPAIRHLAGMPPHIAGVLYHRGSWLPAVDAAARLGLTARAGRSVALIVRRGHSRFALTADQVLGIRDLSDLNDMGIATTDLGIVTPVEPQQLFRAELNDAEEVNIMPAASGNISLVVFTMNGEEFSSDIANVVEVLEYRPPVFVPRAPAFVEGVVHVRDFVLPILDLRKRMEIPVRAPTSDTRIIVVLIDDERVGLLVDSVVEVTHVSIDEIAQPPAFFRGLSADYLQGLAQLGKRLILVLRLERILTSQERIALLRADFTEPETELVPIGAEDEKPKKRGRRST